MPFRKIPCVAALYPAILFSAALALGASAPAGAASITVSGPVNSVNSGSFPGFEVEIFLDLNLDAVDTDPSANTSTFDSAVTSGAVFVDGSEFFTFDAPSIATFNVGNFDAVDDAFDTGFITWTVSDGAGFEITGALTNDLGILNGADLSSFSAVIDRLDTLPAEFWFARSGSIVIDENASDFDYDPFSIAVTAVPLPFALPLFIAGLAGLGVVRIRRR